MIPVYAAQGDELRIAYVCYWFLLERDGVVNKINGQVARWRAEGHEVEVFCLARVYPSQQTGRSDWRRFFFDSIRGRFRATGELVDAVRAYSPDVVYLRYGLFPPPLPTLLRELPTAIEVNADDREEVRLRGARARLEFAYNELNRRALLARAAGLVCVTHELARSPRFASFRKPTEVVANGIDLAAIGPAPPAGNDRPRIVFLGSTHQRWHGVDKMAWLARQLPEADFHLIGYRPEHIDLPLSPNVTSHGILARDDYGPIVAGSDLALGTLALHRKNMHEACPLKVREYLAYGIPVVIAYEDTDFLGETPWFLLKLTNTEENVRRSVPAIRDFLARVRGRRVTQEEVRERIGLESKERRRLAFLAGLAR